MTRPQGQIVALTRDKGSGKGQMAAWKSAKAAKLYEERGGSYEGKAGSKNEPSKGKPEAKSSAKVIPDSTT